MEQLAELHFLRPLWLLGLLPCVLLFWGLWRKTRSHLGWSKMIDQELLPHLLVTTNTTSKRAPIQAILLWWVLIILALAGPSWEQIPQPVQRRQEALVLLLDLSPSMLTEDIKPSRLQRSKHKLRDLLKNRTEGTTGMIAFAGDAHVVSPLTDDVRTISNLVPALHPDMMPAAGSDAAAAVELAIELLQAAGMLEGQILLLTDGVNIKRRASIARLTAKTNYTLSVIGVGTEAGEPIVLTSGKLQKDRKGEIVIAKLDRDSLRALARANGGKYHDLSLTGIDLSVLDHSDLAATSTLDNSLRSTDTWHDAGYWLSMACLPLALFAFRRGWLLCLPLLFLIQIPRAEAQPFNWNDLWLSSDQQAARLLRQGKAEAAAGLFEDPEWSAAAHYRAQHYKQAQELYGASSSVNNLYNRGNAMARAGDLPGAIKAYEKALEQSPEFDDALFNKQLLEKLLKQQQNDQQNQSQNQSQNQNQNQEQNQQGQNDKPHKQQQGEGESNPQDQQQNEPSQRQEANSDPEDNPSPSQSKQDKQQQNSEKDQPLEQSPAEQEQADNNPPSQNASTQASSEEQEKDQATEAWLRQVPDDPAGLLRRKFKYESELRQKDLSNTGEFNDDW